MPKNRTPSPSTRTGFMDRQQFLNFLSENGRPLAEKHLKFRRDKIFFDSSVYSRQAGPVSQPYQILNFQRALPRNKLWISDQEASDYLSHLKEMSIDITYDDVRKVVRGYQDVLRKPRRKGMRGDRNFSGKVEDEIRGKLAEECLSKYLLALSGLEFPVFYELLPPGVRRDEGDFEKVILRKDRRISEILLPQNLVIAVKSSNGFFSFAIPENEWSWPGEIYIAVRLHISQDFILRLINKALDIEDVDLRTNAGWLEIDGWLSKSEMTQTAFIGKRLPGGRQGKEEDWSKRNLIMHPLQLHRTRAEMLTLMGKYNEYAREHET